jgi:RES domain
VPAGTELSRVAIDNLGTTEPSASPTLRRFSPVLDRSGAIVPVLYAGDSLACALGETVFHDLNDDPAVDAAIFRADLLTLRAGTLALGRLLELVDLTDASLPALGYGRRDVVDTPPTDYPVTATWGQAAWDTTRAAGIVWNSRRHPDGLSYLLFVDPSRPADRPRAARRREDLLVVSPPLALYDGDGLGEVLTAASDRNVTVLF